MVASEGSIFSKKKVEPKIYLNNIYLHDENVICSAGQSHLLEIEENYE